jgi:protein-tyrosine phosphatase
MIDFHNHILPGVDDGAADAAEALAALGAFRAQGVTAMVATPHVNGSDTREPARLARRLAELDRGWAELTAAAGAEPALHRGAEVMLDTPEPDLSDPRLRLAGTRFVLVEFPFMSVPPNAPQTLFAIRMKGWEPVLAHPERYADVASDLSDVAEWTRVGARLQVNAGSLLGRYGDRPARLAWRMLRRGLVDYVASDHHARGSLYLEPCREELERAGGAEQAELLLRVNAERLLADQAPFPVPPLPRREPSLWRRLLGRRGPG